MSPCPALTAPSHFLGGMLQFIDCQSRTIGAEGYQALASPGSSFSLILTGLLSLFVALFGYRMLLGQMPGMRDGVLAMVKIGLVLALATGWPAYRTLFYDVAFDAPAELAGEIARPAGLVDGNGLAERLQGVDSGLVRLAIVGTGETALTERARLEAGVPPPPFGGFESFALGTGRAVFITSAVAAFGSVRLIAGLLLALGPFFVAFLLFSGTHGFFEGWLRVLVGSVLGALGTTVILSVELALLEPRLADWLARRAVNAPIPGAAVELLAIALVFTLLLLAILLASVRVARGFRLPNFAQLAPAIPAAIFRGDDVRIRTEARDVIAAADERRRAADVADAVAATQRREAGQSAVMGSEGWRIRATSEQRRGQDAATPQPVPIGQSFRRTRNRVSTSAGRRDRRG